MKNKCAIKMTKIVSLRSFSIAESKQFMINLLFNVTIPMVLMLTVANLHGQSNNSHLNGIGFNIDLNNSGETVQPGMSMSGMPMENSSMGEHQGHQMMMMPKAGSPMGVMAGHSHKAGHLMFAYRYKYMSMKGKLLKGSDSISLSNATDYMMLPTEMTMEMHMFSLMYAPIDNMVIIAMLPYLSKKMTMEQRKKAMAGADYQTVKTSGFGDLKLGFGYTFLKLGNHTFHGDLLFGLPTGSISEVNRTTNQNHGYPMQLGSGSYEFLPAITYEGNAGDLGWGIQAKLTFRLNENSNNYTLGNRYEFTGWSAWRFIKWVSLSARLNMDIQQNINGQDANQPAASMMPQHDPKAYGFRRLDGLAGLNFYLPLPRSFMGRIGVEGGIPLYQSVDGIKRGVDWLLVAGIRLGFLF